MASTVRPFAPAPKDTQPPYLHPPYASTVKRAPKRPPIRLEQTLSEVTGPLFANRWAGPDSADLTTRGPIGERIIVAGRVLDADARPVPGTLVELWQCNSAGRYRHPVDQHDAPLDPNFEGAGQVVTNDKGEYRFLTILPGAYPWRNTPNAWRPAHIHFGVYGPAFATRLVTQMYFPGDPLLPIDPIFNSVPDPKARDSLISRVDLDITQPEKALGYRFDIVLWGRHATPMEQPR